MAVLTETQVFTEFDNFPAEVKAVTRPHIVGGQGELHYYSNPAEKPDIDVGTYNNLTPTSYAWPGLSASGVVVDQDSVQVFMDSILLKYFSDGQGVGPDTITPDASYPNRIHTNAATGFATSGSSPRNPALFDRDVQVGDVVHVKYTPSGPSGPTELYTSVNSLIADVIATSIGSATPDTNNPNTQSGSSGATQTGGTVNDVTIATNGSSYSGLSDGFINETYTLTITQGSVGGNATTALFNVTSASGLDNAINVAPSAFGSPTNIGALGMKVTWSHTSNDFVAGQVWTVNVAQAFTKPVATSSGAYTGTQTLTYILTVTKGGLYASNGAQITVTTNIGVDRSGPTTITAASSAFPVGTFGVQVTFTGGTGLRLGDVYYIVANGPGVGAFKTIELNNNLPSALQAAPNMLLELSIQKTGLSIPQDSNSPPTLNWTTEDSGLTLNSGIQMTDPTLTNAGAPVFVPIVPGPNTLVYISYRAWDPDFVNEVGTIVALSTDPTAIMNQVAGVLGPVVPDNPLAYAVYVCLLNANGQPVNFTGLADPAILGNWTDAIAILVGLPVYGLVPLSTDQAVLDAFQAHVDAQSAEGVNKWRVAWFPATVDEVIPVVTSATSSDHAVVLATLVDNPGVVGTQYTYLTITSGNGQLQTNLVQEGDTVRYLFSVDGFGNTTYTEFPVESVVNQDTAILALPGNSVAVNTPQKVEIWRTQSKNAIAEAIAARAEAYADSRVRLVWPDQIDVTSGLVPGYFLCAALAGFTTGIAPHQGIEGIPIAGFTAASRSVSYFSNAQLNILQNAGVFVITQDGSGNVFTRNALTTDQSSPENGLEVVVRNDDAIQRVIANRIAQYFGVANLTDAGIAILQSEVENGFFVLRSNTFVNRLGNMVTDSQVTDIRPSTTDPTAVVVQANVTRPFPVEDLQLNIQFS